MVYPPATEVREHVAVWGYGWVERQFGILPAEAYDIILHGRVRHSTEIWAAEFRTKYREPSHV